VSFVRVLVRNEEIRMGKWKSENGKREAAGPERMNSYRPIIVGSLQHLFVLCASRRWNEQVDHFAGSSDGSFSARSPIFSPIIRMPKGLVGRW